MKRLAVALLLVLAACGGADPAPRATSTQTARSTTTPTPFPTLTESPGTVAVRAAVAKTIAVCPCSVEVALWTNDPRKTYVETFRGVYDAKTSAAELRRILDGRESPLVVRFVGGRAFARGPGSAWTELVHSGLPAKPASPFVTFAVADPRLPLSVVGAVTTASETSTDKDETLYDVEHSMAAAVKAAGPSGPLLARLSPSETGTSRVWLKGGLVSRIEWEAPGTDANREDQIFFTITIKGTGVAAAPLTAPMVSRKVDAATGREIG